MDKPNKIKFILPGPGVHPVGGFKVVYEYANRLVMDGNHVTILYAVNDKMDFSSRNKSKVKTALRLPNFFAKYIYLLITGKFKPKWFAINNAIKHKLRMRINDISVPDGDIVVATAWKTAVWVNKLSPSKGKKYYLIQSFEDWDGSIDDVLATWKFPLHKIVIAPWLKDIAESLGEKSDLIENGLDFSYFGLDRPIKQKPCMQLIMLYHESEMKGFIYGLQAIEIVRQKYPEIKLVLYGVPREPKQLASWITYYQLPDKKTHRKIYNDSAIFVGPSLKEGWCLTPAEAMQCGCAVVCTNIGGYTAVAKHKQTALVSPVKDPISMADNIIRLIENDELRWEIAQNGNEFIQQFTWEKAYGKFKKSIEQI